MNNAGKRAVCDKQRRTVTRLEALEVFPPVKTHIQGLTGSPVLWMVLQPVMTPVWHLWIVWAWNHNKRPNS